MSSFVPLIGDGLVGLLGAIHVYVFNLESLTWYRGSAKSFGLRSPEEMKHTATLAANQGFYNLVLAVGCFWALLRGDLADKLFFVTAILGCGIIGFITTGSAKILRVQGVLPVITLAALFYGAHLGKGIDTLHAGAVVGAALLSVAVSLFVKGRVAGDAEFHAKKNAAK